MDRAPGSQQTGHAPETVAQVVYSAKALANLERTFALLAQRDPHGAIAAARAIRHSVEMLGAHPLLGRRVHGEVRELVISYGRTGYVALYRFVPARDEVRVLAIKYQRELGYRG
jgi:plasmid stabilization system protein ParE